MSLNFNFNFQKFKPLPFLIWVIAGAFVIIGIFFTFFIGNMWGQTTSKDIAHWGQFGDFFGGILNPIISLASLLVLAYLTVMISKNDKEVSLKQYYLEKKLKQYNELIDKYKNFKEIPDILKSYIENNNNFKYTGKDLENYLYDFQIYLNHFASFHTYLEDFELINNHIFNYNFSNKEYKDLIGLNDQLYYYLITFKSDLTSNNIINFRVNENIFKNHNDKLKLFLRELNMEVNSKDIIK